VNGYLIGGSRLGAGALAAEMKSGQVTFQPNVVIDPKA